MKRRRRSAGRSFLIFHKPFISLFGSQAIEYNIGMFLSRHDNTISQSMNWRKEMKEVFITEETISRYESYLRENEKAKSTIGKYCLLYTSIRRW